MKLLETMSNNLAIDEFIDFIITIW